MIERLGGEIIFHCDECSECLETGTHDFSDALSELKEAKWANVKDEGTGEYTHICAACLEL